MGLIQIHASLLCAAGIIAYLTTRGGDWYAVCLVFVACFVGMEGTLWALLHGRRRAIQRETRDFEDQVGLRTLDAARSAALETLSGSKGCRSILRSGDEPPADMSESLRESLAGTIKWPSGQATCYNSGAGITGLFALELRLTAALCW